MFEARALRERRGLVNFTPYTKGGLKLDGSFSAQLYLDLRVIYIINDAGNRSVVDVDYFKLRVDKTSLFSDSVSVTGEGGLYFATGLSATFGLTEPFNLALRSDLEIRSTLVKRSSNYTRLGLSCQSDTKALIETKLSLNTKFLVLNEEIAAETVLEKFPDIPLTTEGEIPEVCEKLNITITPTLFSEAYDGLYAFGSYTNSSGFDIPNIEYKITNHSAINVTVTPSILTSYAKGVRSTDKKEPFRQHLNLMKRNSWEPTYPSECLRGVNNGTNYLMRPSDSTYFGTDIRCYSDPEVASGLRPSLDYSEHLTFTVRPETPFGFTDSDFSKTYSFKGKLLPPEEALSSNMTKNLSSDLRVMEYFNSVTVNTPFERFPISDFLTTLQDGQKHYNFYILSAYKKENPDPDPFAPEYLYFKYLERYDGASKSVLLRKGELELIGFKPFATPKWVSDELLKELSLSSSMSLDYYSRDF